MVFNQVLQDSPPDIVWNYCFTCPMMVMASELQLPLLSLSRKVRAEPLQEWEPREQPAVFPSPKLGLGLSSSSLITITTVYTAFTVNQTLPPLFSKQPHEVDHYDTHFTNDLTEHLRGQVLGQGTQQGLECTSF